MRPLRFLIVLALAGALFPLAPARAFVPAPTPTGLSATVDMEVGDSYVFVSGQPTGAVMVFDHDATLLGAIDGLVGVDHMALDGTDLWVAVRDSDHLLRYDVGGAMPFPVTSFDLSPLALATGSDIGVAGGRVWFENDFNKLAPLDPSDGSVGSPVDVGTVLHVLTASGVPDALWVGFTEVTRYQASGDTLTPIGSSAVDGDLSSWRAVSADGSSYLIPQIFPDRVIEYDGSTLQKRPPLYNAMSATSGGMLNPAGTRLAVLAGTWLRIFNTATRAQVFERNLKFDRPFGSANTVAYSPDGSTLFLVVTKEPATDPRLLAIPAVPKQATLTVSGPRHAAYGATARITVHLAGGSSTNRRVRLYMQPSNKPRTLVRNVKVNAAGNLLYSAKLTRRTVFTAEWDGDAAYFSERSARTVTVGALMRTALSGFYRKAGAYHLYHRGAKPVFAARVLPATPSKQGERVQFVLERHANGAWHRVGAKVVRMSQQNIAAVRLIGFGVGDYRIRAVFRGDSLNTSTPSRFSFLRITN